MMVLVHMTIGLITLLLAIIAFIWSSAAGFRGDRIPKPLRGALIGLMHLQIVLGIITWFVARPGGGVWWLHPIFMVIAVILAMVYTKQTRSARQQWLGYTATLVFLVLGIWMGNL